MLIKRGILATAVNHKEKSAERELMEYLEQASVLRAGFESHADPQIADELYPETIEKDATNDDDDDIDLEEMLKRELEGMTSTKSKKSNRFSECRRPLIWPC